MITFFHTPDLLFAVETTGKIIPVDIAKLSWLFGDAQCVAETVLPGQWIGPRKEMITPWSTNAVEITQNMGITGIRRIEEFTIYDLRFTIYDLMLEQVFNGLDQEIFTIQIGRAHV